MVRNLALDGDRTPPRSLGSIACLALILLLAAGFWAAIIWGGSLLFRLVTG